MNSVFFTENGPNGIPTGKLSPCIGSELDFLTSRLLGERIHDLLIDRGYDHNFLIDGEGLKEAAVLYHEPSRRKLTIYSDQPGLQVYTANWWDGLQGVHNKPYKQHAAVALETQNFPDAPNHKNFPNAILYPGREYRTQTIYKFTID